MQYRNLGPTDFYVSSIGMGCVTFGRELDPHSSLLVMDHAFEQGITLFDTAEAYAQGASERVVGEWLQSRHTRDKIVLATKIGGTLTRQRIIGSAEDSLKRLQTDRIDLLQTHLWDQTTPLEETLEAFNQLVQAGKVRYIGGSNYLAWRLEQAKWISETHGWAQYCCVQQHYTYLRLRPGTNVSPQIMVNDDLLDYIAERGITLLAYSVLQSGAHTRADRALRSEFSMPDNERRLEALRAVAAETGAGVNQVILAWMLQRQVIPLIAASTEEQLAENLDALHVNLSAEQMDRLNRAGTE